MSTRRLTYVIIALCVLTGATLFLSSRGSLYGEGSQATPDAISAMRDVESFSWSGPTDETIKSPTTGMSANPLPTLPPSVSPIAEQQAYLDDSAEPGDFVTPPATSIAH